MLKRDPIFGSSLNREPSRTLLFFKRLWNVLNPKKYSQIVETDFSDSINFFSHTLFFAIMILGIIALILLVYAPNTINDEFSKITNLKLQGDLMFTEPVTFQKIGVVLSDNNTYNGENVLYTRGFFYTKPLLCFFVKSYCLINNKPVKMSYSFENDKDDFADFALYITLFMLPAILVITYLFLWVKYSITILLAGILGYVYVKLSSKQLTLRKLFVAAFFASPVLMFIDVWPWLFVDLYFAPTLIYLLFYGIIIKQLSK